jgi:restriction system protein
MAIPDYQSCMLPLMHFVADGQEHSLAEAIETLAREFGLSEEERRELLPSGRQPRFDNRVGWAKTYLQKAGLLEAAGRAAFRITPRGIATVQERPTVINDKYLLRFPEYVEFKKRTNKQDEPIADPQLTSLTNPPFPGSVRGVIDVMVPNQTPEETLDTSYQTLRRNLAQELLERVKRNSPRFFERLVVDLLVAMGYGGSRQDAGQAIGMSGDEGIDGIIKEDRLGLDVVYIQAKRWDGTVGRPAVQAFAGSLEGQRARKGVLITTSQFSKEAQEYVRIIEKRIVLVDGEQLAQLMIDFGIGVTEIGTYVVKKLDSDFFGDE